MSIPRLLLLSLLAPSCALAQTAAEHKPQIADPSSVDPNSVTDSLNRLSAAMQLSPPGQSSMWTIENGQVSKVVSCYTMRTYHFKREDTRSNSKLKQDGYSTCQPANDSDLKKTSPQK